jgi:cobalt/nickel transport protein
VSGLRGVPTRVLVVTGLLVALLLAGVASYYAASAPDGLTRVALDEGFAATAEERNDVTPLAGYETAGVDDDRLSGALAGVAGCVVVLALAAGLTRLLRSRSRAEAAPRAAAEAEGPDPLSPR